MNRASLAALTVDLDALPHYHRIHGLAPPGEIGDDPACTVAVTRFGELCARLGLRGTAFCVGEDLAHPAVAASVGALAAAGHELANHTLSHPYQLSRLAPAEIAAEVRGGAEAIRRLCGPAPVGFRAPGYTLSPALLGTLVAEGYRYDASTFPAFPYYLGKAAVMAGLAVLGRPSGAVLDRPRVLLAPRLPYRPAAQEVYAAGSAWGGLPILELPVATGLCGFPLVGTFLATLPPTVSRALAWSARRRPLLDLELHAIDLLDQTDRGVSPALAARRRDLRIPAPVKVRRLEEFLRGFADREWVTLAVAAERLCGSLGG